jgi:hypothetical protein
MALQGLTAAKLLDVWERGHDRHPAERALMLLAAAYPDRSPDDLLRMSVGDRDRMLLDLREAVFGPSFTALTACPACGEEMELEFRTADVRAGEESGPERTFSLLRDGYTVEFRLPTSGDLLSIAGASAPLAASLSLIDRCVTGARRGGEPIALTELPPEILDAIDEEMMRADPQADITLDLACYSCNHQWQATFDIASFLWAEVAALARRLLREVHALAFAYGWREADILAMSAQRRERYLELLER